MSDLSYRDHCRITRDTGEYDEWDVPIDPIEIYDGKCDFQGGGQTPLSIVTHNDVVYLPLHVMVETNDIIKVTTDLGRKREGIVGNVNDLGLDPTGDWITEIEIKQSTEK